VLAATLLAAVLVREVGPVVGIDPVQRWRGGCTGFAP